jgi:vacuolar protein sorting-associated protein 72
MADDETADDTPQLSDTDSSDAESESAPVESLVAGRERRKTAGNRYDRDMVLEEAGDAEDPDEVTLLFADDQDEEDDEFRSNADDEDADMSSSDDDDQGPNAAAEDLEGEKELQTQAKQEKAKKRKADLALTSVAGVRKKLKTDPTRPAAASAPAKPSKKKERVTWVHDENSGRSSLRKQTIAHREETIARLKESEAQSKKLKALKEKRDRERAKDAPRELTQADRLAEAAKVERQNAKSLNRWEATERKRQEEQAAKLAALKNRKLEGPVVTWLSQKTKWVGPDLSKIATKDAVELTGPKKRGRKSKAELELIAAEKAAESTGMDSVAPATTSILAPHNPPVQGPAPEMVPMPTAGAGASQPQIMLPPSDEFQDSILMGIHEYANADSNASESKPATPAPQELDVQRDTEMKEMTQQNIEKPPEAPLNHVDSQTETPGSVVKPALTQTISGEDAEGVTIKTEIPTEQTQIPTLTSAPLDPGQLDPVPLITEHIPEPQPPQVEEDTTRNLIILEKFDELASDARQEYSFFYNKKATARTGRAVKQSQELCLITALPVRYRDPSTGIAYANAVAYRKLQALKEHKFAWSSMLGCYVGRESGITARGVPEGFG